MTNCSVDVPKRTRGRPSSPSRTDAYREEALHRVIASVRPKPGARLRPLIRQVVDRHGGPQDEHEVRRLYDRYWNHFIQPPQYDRIRHRTAERGTRARIKADSPDLPEAMRTGWFPDEVINDELIIERHLSPDYRFRSQEEAEKLAGREFERMLTGMGPICVALP